MKNETKKQDDAFLNFWMDSQPILTKSEQEKEIENLNKCADFVLKNKLTPNLDFPEYD